MERIQRGNSRERVKKGRVGARQGIVQKGEIRDKNREGGETRERIVQNVVKRGERE